MTLKPKHSYVREKTRLYLDVDWVNIYWNKRSVMQDTVLRTGLLAEWTMGNAQSENGRGARVAMRAHPTHTLFLPPFLPVLRVSFQQDTERLIWIVSVKSAPAFQCYLNQVPADTVNAT
jgi:hypothetical protein